MKRTVLFSLVVVFGLLLAFGGGTPTRAVSVAPAMSPADAYEAPGAGGDCDASAELVASVNRTFIGYGQGETLDLPCEFQDYDADAAVDWVGYNTLVGDLDGPYVNDGCPAKDQPEDPQTQCHDDADDDGDTVVNDGCPAVGDPETGAACDNNVDDDDDGTDDLIWSWTGVVNRTYVGLSDPGGTLTFPVEGGEYYYAMHPVQGDWSRYRTLVGDVNGDGKDDVIWNEVVPPRWGRYWLGGKTGWNRTYVGLSQGDGTLNFPVIDGKYHLEVAPGFDEPPDDCEGFFPIGCPPPPTSTTLVGDVDGDGDDDLIWILLNPVCGDFWDPTCQFPQVGSVRTYVGLSQVAEDGTFEGFDLTASQDPASWVPSTGSWDYWEGNLEERTLVGDVDGDGDDDLILNNPQAWWGETNRIHLGLSEVADDGTFTFDFPPATDHPSTGSFWGDYKTLVGDVDGDGKDDLIWNKTLSSNATHLGLSRVSEEGVSFDFPNPVVHPVTGVWPHYKTLVGDVDGDGRDDLIWNETRDANYTYLGVSQGDGTFTFPPYQQHPAQGKWREAWERGDHEFVEWEYKTLVGDVDADGKDDLIWNGVAGGDGDDVYDWLEDELGRMFAPVVKLDSRDRYEPDKIESYLQNVEMRFNVYRRCLDRFHGGPPVTVDRLLSQSDNQTTKGWPSCNKEGYLQWSGFPNFRPSDFFLQIARNEGTTRDGSTDRAVCYAHIRPAQSSHAGMYDLTYIFFYPYNGNMCYGGPGHSPCGGAHEGDWEHITVRVQPDGSDGWAIHDVYYANHEYTDGRWYEPWEFETVGDKHPKVYSAWHSHASYPSPGKHARGGGLPDDFADGGGDSWDCSERLQNLGRPGSEWVQYNGRWGEIGLVNSGPLTPTFQAWWRSEESPGHSHPIVPVHPHLGSGLGPPLLTAPADQTADEGTPTEFDLGQFDDSSGEPWNVAVDWGDGSEETAFEQTEKGEIPHQEHTYADGTQGYSVTVRVCDEGNLCAESTFDVTVDNVAPVITAEPTTVDENGVATVSGMITDPGILDKFTVEIDWGEGAPETFSYDAGTTSYSETHQYLDDNPTDTPSDVYPVSVSIEDDDGGTGTNYVTPVELGPGRDADQSPGVARLVGDQACNGGDGTGPTCTWVEVSPGPAGVGQPASIHEGTCADLGAVAFPLNDVVDGMSYTDLDVPLPDLRAGTFAINVAESHEEPDVFVACGDIPGTARTTVTVNNVAPVITAQPTTIDENGVATVAGTITDPGTQDTFTVVIDWGEGAPESFKYGAGTTSYSQTHQYLDDNPTGTPSDVYPINVSIEDDDQGTGSATTTVTVNNVNPVVSIDSITDENGAEIGTDVHVAVTNTAVDVAGHFTDIGTLDTHKASIDWGDGDVDDLGDVTPTSPISATHVYSDPCDCTITLTVTDDDSGVGTATADIKVVDASGAINEVIDDLIPHGGDPNVGEALNKLRGDDGGLDSNGALDMLEKGNLNAALEKIKQALEYLEAAEAADPGLDFTDEKGLLSLAAKSVAVGAIDQAEAAASKPKDLDKVQQARDLVAEGDGLRLAGDYIGAVGKYQEAVRKVQGLLPKESVVVDALRYVTGVIDDYRQAALRALGMS